MSGPALTQHDRLTIGKARKTLRQAADQLDLALDRHHRDTSEAALRVGYAALQARDAADICRRLYLRLDRRDPPWPPEQEDAEADRPEDLPVPANADQRSEELDGRVKPHRERNP